MSLQRNQRQCTHTWPSPITWNALISTWPDAYYVLGSSQFCCQKNANHSTVLPVFSPCFVSLLLSLSTQGLPDLQGSSESLTHSICSLTSIVPPFSYKKINSPFKFLPVVNTVHSTMRTGFFLILLWIFHNILLVV